MGRTGRPLLLGATALAVAATGVAVVAVRGEVPLSRAGTVLTAATRTSVTGPDGARSRGYAGERLAPGDVVHTAAGGAAELVTRSRVVRLTPSSVVEVVDGATQQLRSGSAVVDARQGPGVRMLVAGDRTDVAAGAAVRIDRTTTVRVAGLDGPASRLASGSGRTLTVPSLWQVVVAGDALPSTTTPLRLTDDTAEAAVVPQLVTDDTQLTQTARGLDTTGTVSLSVVTASWSGPTRPPPAGAGRSESVLPMLLAEAAGSPVAQRYDDAVRWRRAGGSWGVVAALLHTGSGAVLARLAALEDRVGPTSAATLLARPATAGTGTAGGTPRPTGASGGTPAPRPGGSPPARHRPTGGRPTPTPTPTPTSGPVRSGLTKTRKVVKKVLSLLPPHHKNPLTGTRKRLGGLLGQ